MASIDICYAAAAYKSVAESENNSTHCTDVAVAGADFVTTDMNCRRTDLNTGDACYQCARFLYTEHLHLSVKRRSTVRFVRIQIVGLQAVADVRTEQQNASLSTYDRSRSNLITVNHDQPPTQRWSAHEACCICYTRQAKIMTRVQREIDFG